MRLRGILQGLAASTRDGRPVLAASALWRDTPCNRRPLAARAAWLLLLFGLISVVLADVTLSDAWLWAGAVACMGASACFAYSVYLLRRESL